MTDDNMALEAAPQKFTYYPEAGDPEVVTFRGIAFTAGEAVKVEDPEAICKLKGNPSFMPPERREELRARRMLEMDPVMRERHAHALLRARQHMQGLADARGYRVNSLDLDEVPIEVPSNQIDRPTTPSPAANVRQSPAIDRRRLVSHYKDRAKGLAHSTLSEDSAFLKQFWPTISRDRVREIRSEHAPESWKKAGRRS